MMNDKHPEDIIEPLQGSISTLTITRIPTERSMRTTDLLNGVLKAEKDIPEVHIRNGLFDAIEEWLGLMDDGSLGVAAGTFYLYKYIKDYMDLQKV
jgi:folylpolyglutamate synthase/dihydropteroate synthase